MTHSGETKPIAITEVLFLSRNQDSVYYLSTSSRSQPDAMAPCKAAVVKREERRNKKGDSTSLRCEREHARANDEETFEEHARKESARLGSNYNTGCGV